MELPVLIAKAKARSILSRLKQQTELSSAIIITMDQIVLFNEEVREKPESIEQAVAYLSSYSNESVQVINGVVVTHFPSGEQKSSVESANVFWDEIPHDIVMKVVNKGEVFNSAGGFLIEDEDLNPLIKGIYGQLDAVLGFPSELIEQLINKVVIDVEQATYKDCSKDEFKTSHRPFSKSDSADALFKYEK
jgi:septum formation protein